MFDRFRWDAARVYLFIEFAGSAFFSMMFAVTSLYEVTVAGLDPLQLVLVGTALEVSAFVFEIPTGIVADIHSRRLSIIIGYVLMGFGFLVEAFFPAFLPILLAQVLWGLGYTFTSGATQAWISDEIGEAPANQLFVRANRVGLTASLIGMAGAVLIGANQVVLPLRAGAFGVILTGLALIFIMPETGFRPAPQEDRSTWGHMLHTLNEGVKAVKARPRLMTILGVGFLYGLYSEGFDRLWVRHLLDHGSLPVLFGRTDVAFFGLLRAAGMLLALPANALLEKRIDTGSPREIGRAMLGLTLGVSAGLVGFALSPVFGLTLAMYLGVSVLRSLMMPLYSAWINQKLDPATRATVHSMAGQVDAVGQIAGGPGVGLIARFLSVQAAITASGLMLLPAALLARSAQGAEPDSPVN